MIYDGVHIKFVPDLFVCVCVCAYMYVYFGSDRGHNIAMRKKHQTRKLEGWVLVQTCYTQAFISPSVKWGSLSQGHCEDQVEQCMRTTVKTEDAVHEKGRAALLLLNSIISLHSKH